ncbi:MAG: hypothetical protein ACRBDI_02420 [Alphaproteobacteria bacterium]
MPEDLRATTHVNNNPTLSFSEAVADAAKTIDAKGVSEFSTNAVVLLSRNPELVEEIGQHLKELGHESFEFAGNGSDAFALRTESGMVIRFDEEIRGRIRLEREPVKHVLQVDGDYTHSGIRYEVMQDAPSLENLLEEGKISASETYDLFHQVEVGLAKDGKVALDLKGADGGYRADQIGLKADGTPVILDPGAEIVDAEELFNNSKKNFRPDSSAERWVYGIYRKYEINRAEPDPPYDWSSEQAKIDAKAAAGEIGNVGDNIAEARALAKTADTLEGVQELSRMAKLARMGGNVPLVGIGVSLGAAVLTHIAHDAQKDMAQEFHAQGILSDTALEKYQEMSADIEKVMAGDAAIGAVDPTGASIVVTAGVEAWAKSKFEEWADEYAPHLSEDQYQALSMSLFSGTSARAEMLLESANELPKRTEGVPEEFHAVIEANNEYRMAVYDRQSQSHGDYDQPVDDPEAVFKAEADAKQNLIVEMDKLMSDPEQVQAFLEILPVEERLDYARKLAKSEDDPANFTKNHPEIAAYVEAYEDSNVVGRTVFGLDEQDTLEQNTALINDYIMGRSQGVAPDALEVRPEQMVFEQEQEQEQDKGYTKGVEGTAYTTERVDLIIVGPPEFKEGELTANGMTMSELFNNSTEDIDSGGFKMVNSLEQNANDQTNNIEVQRNQDIAFRI